jgi:DNA-directed RNA polymerase specialized sigma24 family protein
MSATAEAFLLREYEALRGDVLLSIRGRLKVRRIVLDDADLDAVYNQAWHALYDRLAAGEDVENPAGFLVTVGYRRAIEELRRQRADTRADPIELEELGVDHDVVARLDDATRVRHVVEGMKERLDERECKAAALCLIHGYTRPEAADLLGESLKRMEKVMDGVQRKLAGLTADIDDWCHSRRSMIKAYALGLLEPGGERHAHATEHLAGCSACRSYVNSTRGLAAALPPVALPLAGGGSTLERLNSLAAAAWQHGEHAVETATVAGGAALGAATSHGGPWTTVAKVTAGSTVAIAAVAGALAVAGVLGGEEPKPAAVRTTPTPTSAVTASTPAPAAASTPAPAAAASKPKEKASKPKRRKRRHAAKPAPVVTPAPTAPPVVTPAATAPPVVTPAATAPPVVTQAATAPPVVTQAATAVPTPRPTIVTDAAQEFGGK